MKTKSMVAEAVKTKSIGAEAEAVLKPGSGSESGSSWLLISGSKIKAVDFLKLKVKQIHRFQTLLSNVGFM